MKRVPRKIARVAALAAAVAVVASAAAAVVAAASAAAVVAVATAIAAIVVTKTARFSETVFRGTELLRGFVLFICVYLNSEARNPGDSRSSMLLSDLTARSRSRTHAGVPAFTTGLLQSLKSCLWLPGF